MIAEPMLAPTGALDISTIKYPKLASYKYDGVRAIVQEGNLLSRRLKLIKNANVRAKFAGFPDGIDGELIVGEPTARDKDGKSTVFSSTQKIVSAKDKSAANVKLYVFDWHDAAETFEDRFAELTDFVGGLVTLDVVLVEHKMIHNEVELLEMEGEALEAGYEGLMLRDPKGPYKEGRTTHKQGWLLKVKRFLDSECEILGFVELMHNTNEAKTNELGRTQRSTHKAGMVPGGVLGKFLVRDVHSGVEIDIGGGLKGPERAAYWKQRKSLIGKILKYKYFPVGVKDKPRFPVILGFRDKDDM